MSETDAERLARILSDRLARETGKPARVTVKEGYAYVQSGAGEIVRYRVDPEAHDNLATYEEDRSGVAFPDGLLIPDTEELDLQRLEPGDRTPEHAFPFWRRGDHGC